MRKAIVAGEPALKHIYSISMAIQTGLCAIAFTGFLFGICFFAQKEDPAPIPALVLIIVLFTLMIVFLFCLSIFGMQQITITKDSVKISLFGKFFIKEFQIDDIADIVYSEPRRRTMTVVMFSKVPISSVSSRAERKALLKMQITFILDVGKIQLIQDMIGKPIRQG